MRKRFLFGGLLVIAAAGAMSYTVMSQEPAGAPSVKRPAQQTKTPPEPAVFNKQLYSLTDPTSIWVIANKKRPLQPQDYAPSDLVQPNMAVQSSGAANMKVRQQVATALEKMAVDAKANGTPIKLVSGYRSYDYQVTVYNRYVQSQGQAAADAESARPGYSEHQTGLAADVGGVNDGCVLDQCYGNTPSGKWVAANAYKYGFVIRYGDGQTATTGYLYEPWHLRYVGTELSNEVQRTGTATLEDFFGLEAAGDY